MQNFKKYYPAILIVVSFLLYTALAYEIVREDFVSLISAFGITFLVYFTFVKNYLDNGKWLFVAFILFRLIFVFYTPSLSQDYFRFIWDGRLLSQGFNPYLYLPNDLILSSDFIMAESQQLFDGMGSLSAKHYSNYPPVNQLCFWVAGVLSNSSIFGAITVLRLIIVLADIGVLYFGKKLLMTMGLNPNKIYFYLLNPLVILELTGNLHFEGVMLFFLIWSMYLLQQNKWMLSAVVFALSISVKLLPLLLIPVFFQKLKFQKFILFGSVIIGVNILLFLPFLSEQLVSNYTNTIGLWFTNFEFNASIYYLIRYIGYQITGYNVIQIIGRFTPFVVILMVLLFSFIRKNDSISELFKVMLLILTCYFFLSTTVHPWYIISLVILSIFAPYNYAYIWSGVVMVSYFAYSNPEFKENNILITMEYGLVVGFIIYELLIKSKHSVFKK